MLVNTRVTPSLDTIPWPLPAGAQRLMSEGCGDSPYLDQLSSEGLAVSHSFPL